MSGKRFLCLRAFALAFAASFLLLSAVAALAVWRITDGAAGSSASTAHESADAYIPQEEDSRTVVLIGSDAPGGAPSYFTLLRLNVPGGDIPVLSFPWQTLFEHGGKRLTAREIVLEHGPDALCADISAGLSIEAFTWIRWDADACDEAVDLLGPFDFVLSDGLYYSDSVRQISLSRGNQRVDGKKYADMVTFPDYPDEARRCDMESKLLAALLDRRMPALSDREVLAAVLRLCGSNITAKERAAYLPVLKFYAGLRKSISYHVTCQTESSGGGAVFSDTTRARISKYF